MSVNARALECCAIAEYAFHHKIDWFPTRGPGNGKRPNRSQMFKLLYADNLEAAIERYGKERANQIFPKVRFKPFFNLTPKQMFEHWQALNYNLPSNHKGPGATLMARVLHKLLAELHND